MVCAETLGAQEECACVVRLLTVCLENLLSPSHQLFSCETSLSECHSQVMRKEQGNEERVETKYGNTDEVAVLLFILISIWLETLCTSAFT